jgi:hypothetical protein
MEEAAQLMVARKQREQVREREKKERDRDRDREGSGQDMPLKGMSQASSSQQTIHSIRNPSMD